MQKRNAEYVGVSEEFLEEERKYTEENPESAQESNVEGSYVDESLYGDADATREEVQQRIQKGRKFMKSASIAYIIFFVVMILLVIGIFVFSIVMMVNMQKSASERMSGLGGFGEAGAGAYAVEWFDEDFDDYSVEEM